ncbi:MAG: hypothetical protein Ct9H300mP19_07000 [Dehalococcoidia bacterium]|nr:MAG: hypothetical protein Ct9H300mP19_07000 [Dehalococcoidia bacterium]
MRENGGSKGTRETNLSNLVEKGVITQAEGDEILAWKDAKPSYLKNSVKVSNIDANERPKKSNGQARTSTLTMNDQGFSN